MHYKVKVIQVIGSHVQTKYSNNVTAEYTFLVDAVAAIRQYLSGPNFNLKVNQLHYYVKVCGTGGPPLFNYLYIGDHQSILNCDYTPFPFETEESVLQLLSLGKKLKYPIKSLFEIET